MRRKRKKRRRIWKLLLHEYPCKEEGFNMQFQERGRVLVLAPVGSCPWQFLRVLFLTSLLRYRSSIGGEHGSSASGRVELFPL